MNYEKECDKLGTTNAMSLGTGKYKLLLMSEPEECEYKDEVAGKIVPQIKLSVRVDDEAEEKTWYIGKSVTTRGAYGQLMLIGRFHGQLKGQSLNLSINETIQGGKKTKSYIIDEALPLIQKMEKAAKEKAAAAGTSALDAIPVETVK